MRIPDAVSEVYITDQLFDRIASRPDHLREKMAVRVIARQMVSDPSQVLPVLVDLAVDLCGAAAGGISVYEPTGEVFRWHHLRGTLEKFSGATTPRHDSPCGITLDQKSVVLVQHPERVYSWLVEADVALPEVLLVPLYIGESEPLGTLWIVSDETGYFNEGHAATMEELADFTGIALQMIRTEERLKSTLEEQETLAREMGHRVKNLFAITDAMIRMSARSAGSKEEMAESLSGRLHALSGANALVRRTFDTSGRAQNASNLAGIITVVLRPYTHATLKLEGPALEIGEHATNAVALIFHELATNAAKYGALSGDAGTVAVTWTITDETLTLTWSEHGGPTITAPPDSTGFGTRLVATTVVRHGGSIASNWKSEGVEVTISMPLQGLRH